MNPEGDKKKSRFSRMGWLGALLLFIGTKLKTIIPLLKLSKFGGTFISMAISLGAYALIAPFQFALGLVIMIFIHELGHVWAAKLKGIPVSAPAFIPFIGALITMKRQPSDAATEAFIAYGGPLVGTIGAVASFIIGVFTGIEGFYMVAFVGIFINLLNLIPMYPLDGGRIVVAITRWLWVLGLIVGLAVIIKLKSILLTIVYLLFVWELWSNYGRKRNPKTKTTNMKLKTNINPFLFDSAGIYVPGEEHRRELPFSQSSNIQTKEEFLEIEYPGAGVIATISPFTIGEVQRVELIRTINKGNTIEMHFEVKIIKQTVSIGGMQQDEKYYKVPPKLRWTYGMAYIGLIAFLVYMFFLLDQYM